MRVAFAILSIVLWAGVASAADPEAIREFISVPVEDRLSGAIAAGDHRYLGVNGYTVEIPGLKDARLPASAVQVIPGTSDDGDSDLNDSARAYAEQYNRLLTERLKKIGG